MRKLDIISPSPNSFIFQEESNKTLFGGILSLIYLVSIFTNLMMTNRFETNLNILCNEDIDKLFLYNENTNINIFQENKSSTSDNSDNNKGRLLIYHYFFR